MSVTPGDLFQSPKPESPLRWMWYSLCVEKMKKRKGDILIGENKCKQSSMKTTQSKTIIFLLWLAEKKNPKKSLDLKFTPKCITNCNIFMIFPLLMGYKTLLGDNSPCSVMFLHIYGERHWCCLSQNIFSECLYSEQPWKEEMYPLSTGQIKLQPLKLEIVSPFGAMSRHTYCPLWAQNFSSVKQSIKCAGVPWMSSCRPVKIGPKKLTQEKWWCPCYCYCSG